jgi:hypothetical protein
MENQGCRVTWGVDRRAGSAEPAKTTASTGPRDAIEKELPIRAHLDDAGDPLLKAHSPRRTGWT